MVIINDSIHCEYLGEFNNFEDAIAELKRYAAIPWDQPPNCAPCTSWRKCGREYELREYDTSCEPHKLLRSVPALNISASGIEWVAGFEQSCYETREIR